MFTTDLNNDMHILSTVNKVCFLFILNLLLPVVLLGQLRLPSLLSDGMVLQREVQIPIWGWDKADELVSISFNGNTYTTTTNDKGKWQIKLRPQPAGGPYSMIINGTSRVTLNDILIGDVWIASGQSNMELWMGRVKPVYGDIIANANNSSIRQFMVPDEYDFNQERSDLGGGIWQKVNPENLLSFSAVAYFFARHLYRHYNVPIGIINASLGGSPAEAWISEQTLLEKFPHYYRELIRFKNDTLVDSIMHSDQERTRDWFTRLNRNDKGLQNYMNWHDPDLNTSEWPEINIPGYWADTPLGDLYGAVWFRKEFQVPDNLAGEVADLNLGRIVDADSVFINDIFIGSTGYQYPPRWYTIPEGVLKTGANIISARVINQRGRGGFVAGKPYKITLGNHEIDLTGEWKYELGTKMQPLPAPTFVRWKPAGLFNAMISPLLNYSIKGVIWYQGESNTDRPEEYENLFAAMIQDWRTLWNQGEFPFLFVQLANYMEPDSKPSGSNWAKLRESQFKTLSLPNTAMAVTIDIGEWNDIHPLNKKDVGERLALAAQKVAYAENEIVFSGPTYKSITVKNGKAILSFDHIGSGLRTNNGKPPMHFAIAGKDSSFVWAEAKIEGDQLVVWSDKVEKPIAVRYAWADNPESANLYNEEGLPASPFRTDDW